MPQKKAKSEKKDKRYRAKVTIGHDESGRAIVKYASGRTRKELAEHKAELVRRFIGGAEVRRDVLAQSYIRTWFEAFKRPAVSKRSSTVYERILNAHVLPELSDKRIVAITSADVQALIYKMSGLSRSTVDIARMLLREIFKRAYADGLIDRDPTVSLKSAGQPPKRRRALTEAETRAAMRVMDEHPDGLLLALLYYTGARIGEIAALRWSDVDFKRREITIAHTVEWETGEIIPPKTPAGVRRVPIPAELEKRLRAARGLPGAFIIHGEGGRPISNNGLRWRWKRLSAAMAEAEPEIEQKEGKSILTPHYFRHNFSSILHAAGVDVLAAQRIMGHADASITLRTYTHIDEDQQKKAADQIRRAFE